LQALDFAMHLPRPGGVQFRLVIPGGQWRTAQFLAVAGADVDDCLPNPNADIGSDRPGAYPQLLPGLVFGVGD
jgi:hypothetical protein